MRRHSSLPVPGCALCAFDCDIAVMETSTLSLLRMSMPASSVGANSNRFHSWWQSDGSAMFPRA